MGEIYTLECEFIYLTKGEVVTFRKGAVVKSYLREQYYKVKKMKHLGNGEWEILEKKPIKVKEKTTTKKVVALEVED